MSNKIRSVVHLLEFGLGDTVNSISLILSTKKKFLGLPHHIYVEERWSSIVGNFLSSKDSLIKYNFNNEYYEDLILRVYKENNDFFFVNHLNRFSDQWSFGESKQESLARHLKLSSFEDIRPIFFNNNNNEIDKEVEFLDRINLSSSKYIVIAPNLGRETIKFLGKSYFEILSEKLFEEFNLPIVTVGLKGEGDIENEHVSYFENLKLEETSWIIKNSAFFVGMDSGLSHIAASFDIPIFILYPYIDKDVMPFEVKVHSPFSNMIIISKAKKYITCNDLIDVIRNTLGKDFKQKIFFCHSCGKNLSFIKSENIYKDSLYRFCVCGSGIFITKNIILRNENNFEFFKNNKIFMPRNYEEVKKFFDKFEKKEFDEFVFEFDLREVFKRNDDYSYVIWSLDGFFNAFNLYGFSPYKWEKIKIKKGLNSRFQIVFKKNIPDDHFFEFLWDGKYLKSTIKNYKTYFSWEFWGSKVFLEKLCKKIYKEKNGVEDVVALYSIFRYLKTFDSLKYLIKSFSICIRMKIVTW